MLSTIHDGGGSVNNESISSTVDLLLVPRLFLLWIVECTPQVVNRVDERVRGAAESGGCIS